VKDYSDRSVVDKLGIKLGAAVAFEEAAGVLDGALEAEVLSRANLVEGDERPDVVLVAADASVDAVAVLHRWKARLAPAGGVWLLTPKRGQVGYLDQRELIAAGLTAGLVDNKVCSVSDTISAMRFVIRRADRTTRNG
jgi:hypothetical protein